MSPFRGDVQNSSFIQSKNDSLNMTAQQKDIDKQRDVITNMISNSRANVPSLFKHEFFDCKDMIAYFEASKQLEIERIIQKKIRSSKNSLAG